ncbi:GNAT family N-acetyltransferase [Chitinimonas sp. BJB300]|uniref:GNAT family N-acetyltransferase n=1 Tax=Chitinimonas sp. BJB300 TaxID=1559339 RepID=UPI0013046351|nr:GNAT family N-acetyltransferase [Chitinimonas sp. BJB300]
MLTTPLADARLDALSEADFEAVTRLGEVIWRAHYPKMISMAQIDYMLAGRYTPDKLRAYLNADDRWMMLLKLADKPIGYCSYARTPTPGELKLEQLYLLQEYQGQGLGRLMLRHVESRAQALGLGVLLLQVNKHNVDAIAVYKKTGFTVREAAVFDVGGGFVMDDYVMEKVL